MSSWVDVAARNLHGTPLRQATLACTALAVTLVAVACGGGREATSSARETAVPIQITSPAFNPGEPIPTKYTCDGEDVSPPLRWIGMPQTTQSIAIIVEDPDAPSGTFVHWVIYDIPGSATELPEGLPKTESLPSGVKQGVNDFKKLGYGGPCPPQGSAHRYDFHIYALDLQVQFRAGMGKQELLNLIEGHVTAQGILMGTYRRR
jgi:Raf kinase inhibitor-like YbhB/YbcL family protein